MPERVRVKEEKVKLGKKDKNILTGLSQPVEMESVFCLGARPDPRCIDIIFYSN
jgi:hypothetical protein